MRWPLGRRRLFGNLGCLAHNQMSVGSAEAKGTHGRDALPSAVPFHRSSRNGHGIVFPANMRVRCLEVKVSGNLSALHTQRGLDESGNACGRFEMTNVCFSR